jgi:uncharacterized damage-inducible protein DinB
MFDIHSQDVAPALALPMGEIENAYARLSRLVGGMDQTLLDYRGPDGTLNSAAMLVRHLILVDLEYLSRIAGEPISPELEAIYGPFEDENGRIPAVAGRPEGELLEGYGKVISLIRAYLKTKTDAEAARPVTIPWWPEQATVRYVLWHMAGHCMFHQGQIARLQAAYREQSGT